MIQILPNAPASESLVAATRDPKHVWRDIDRIVIYTGSDIPLPPPNDAPSS